jgi:hypothetical protein
MSPFDVSVSYGVKEHCWHGEAGSVDLAAVAEEQKRILLNIPRRILMSLGVRATLPF